MSRFTKILSLTILALFILACSTVIQPFQDAQDLAGTAQSFASALPMETLQAVASQMPVETLQSFMTQVPAETLEALPSQMPDFGMNPQGTPVSEWNGIPIMPQATAGEEYAGTNTYSFKVNASVKEAEEFYSAELPKLGWESSFSMPGNETVAVLLFQKDNDLLTVAITDIDGSVVVMMTMA